MASCILRPDYSADNFNTVCKRTQKIPFLTGPSRPWPPWPQSLTAQRRRTCFVPREDSMDFFTAEKIIQKRPCPVVFFLSSKIPAMSCCFFFKNPGNVCFPILISVFCFPILIFIFFCHVQLRNKYPTFCLFSDLCCLFSSRLGPSIDLPLVLI